MRNFPLFALFALPTLAAFWSNIGSDRRNLGIVFFIALSLFGIVRGEQLFRARSASFGIGLTEGNNAAGIFLKSQQIRGSIFNNYDIGSYLIYHLAPREKVFTDNRPEAYSADFFNRTYILAQEDPKEFDALDRQFHFGAIVFNYRDATPWGQAFLHRAVVDPRFVQVFADDRVIILERRISQ